MCAGRDAAADTGEPPPSPPPPCRSEGKLRSYGSATDARAWSHCAADRSGLVMAAVKRGARACGGAARLVPTPVLLEVLLAGRRQEVARLRARVCELEAALRGRGDAEWQPGARGAECGSLASASSSSLCDCAATSMRDCATNTSRADDPGLLQDEIIRKEAKIAAMQNTIQILEGDVCEPYMVYAYINTTIEKIFALLRQNKDCRTFLNNFRAASEMTDLDVKGRVLVKLRVLELFCSALCADAPREHAHYMQANAKTDTADWSRSLADALAANVFTGDSALRVLCAGGGSDGADATVARLRHMQACHAELTVRCECAEAEVERLQAAADECKCAESAREAERLRERLTELEARLRETSDTCERLQSCARATEEELAYCGARLAAEREVGDRRAAKLEQMASERDRLEVLLDEARADAERQLQRFQLQLEVERREGAARERRVQRVLREMQDMQAQLDQNKQNRSYEMEPKTVEAIQDELINLRSIIKESEAEKLSMQKQLSSKSDDAAALKQDLQYWRVSYEQMANHNITLEKRARELGKQLDEAKERISSLEKLIEQKQNECNLLLQQYHEKKQDMHILELNSEKNVDEKNLLAQETVELKEKVNKMESEIMKILTLLKSDERGFRGCTKLGDPCGDLGEAVTHLHFQNERLRSENDSLKSEVLDKRKESAQHTRKYQTICSKDHVLFTQIIEKEKSEIFNTLQDAKRENADLSNKLLHIESHHDEVMKNCDLLKQDNERLKKDLTDRSNKIYYLNKHIESEKEKSRETNSRLKVIKDKYEIVLLTQKDENKSISEALEIAKKESSQLVQRLNSYEDLSRHLASVKLKGELLQEKEERIAYLEQVCAEKQKQISTYAHLEGDLKSSKNVQEELCKEKHVLTMEVNNLRAKNQEYENIQYSLRKEITLCKNALENAKSENSGLKQRVLDIEQISSGHLADLNVIKTQVETVRAENEQHKQVIVELEAKLEESVRMTLELTEDVLSRDNTIGVLQQHVEGLRAEIAALHKHLEGALVSGEQLHALHVRRTQTSLHAAHTQHSKSTQRLKSEIEKLKETNVSLEKQSEEYQEKLLNLQNEMNIIQGEVQQLRYKTTKELVAQETSSGNVDIIRQSLKSIALLLEDQQSKTICLEQTLQKVQMSSELLRCKADETKSIIQIRDEKDSEETCSTHANKSQEKYEELQRDLAVLNNQYDNSLKEIATLHEKRAIFTNFLGKYEVEIVEVINSIKGQDRYVKALRQLVNEVRMRLKKALIKLVKHKESQTDALAFTHSYTQSSTNRLVNKASQFFVNLDSTCNDFEEVFNYEKSQIEKLEKIENHENVNPEVPNDNYQREPNKPILTLEEQDSLQSLTDDHKLQMSKLQEDKKTDIVESILLHTLRTCTPLFLKTNPHSVQSASDTDYLDCITDWTIHNKSRARPIPELRKAFGDTAAAFNIDHKIAAIDDEWQDSLHRTDSNFFHIFDNDDGSKCRSASDEVSERRSLAGGPGASAVDDALPDDLTPTRENAWSPARTVRRTVQDVLRVATDPQHGYSSWEHAASGSGSGECESNARDASLQQSAVRAAYERSLRRVVAEHEAGVASLQRMHEQHLAELVRSHRRQLARAHGSGEDERQRARELERDNARLRALAARACELDKLVKSTVVTVDVFPRVKRRADSRDSASAARHSARSSTVAAQL